MKTITLALQGGGSHGAFTWGVLERLLDDDRLEIEAVSATSAGAVNGALLVAGIEAGGRMGARLALARFWNHMADLFALSPVQPTPWDRMSGGWGLQFSPIYQWGEMVLRLFSPAQLNPLDVNPLRDVLRGSIDFARLHPQANVKLYVSATNVRTGRVRIFGPGEITEDVLLATTCLPQLYPAVPVGGQYYWDGGFVANPALYPLVHHAAASEVLIVQVTPMGRSELPETADSILHRVNEISFNSSVMREMHALAYITDLNDRGWLDRLAGFRKTHIHMIQDEKLMRGLHPTSRFNAERPFLDLLRRAGYGAADAWLESHYETIGKASTIDVNEVYL